MLKLPYGLSVCGKQELDDFRGKGVTHLLSLEDPGTLKETPRWFRGVHWQLQFHDVESARDPMHAGATPPAREHVAEILRFGQACLEASRAGPVNVLVHCYAGASRSPAACYALIVQALGPGQVQAALDHVLAIRPGAFPNQLVVIHADDLLDCRGEMVRALQPLRRQFTEAVEEWFDLFKRRPGD